MDKVFEYSLDRISGHLGDLKHNVHNAANQDIPSDTITDCIRVIEDMLRLISNFLEVKA